MLRKPEAVLILRNIYFEGLKSGHRFRLTSNAATAAELDDYDLGVMLIPDSYLSSHNTCINWNDFAGAAAESPAAKDGVDAGDVAHVQMQLKAMGLMDGNFNVVCQDPEDGPGIPTRVYRGTTYDNGKETIRTHNNGHMGMLDDYRHTSRLFGATSHVYSSFPDPTDSSKR